MSSPQFDHAIDVGRQARAAAARVRNSLFPAWRQRSFRRHLGRFIVALQQVPQSEAEVLTAEGLGTLNEIVNSVIVEAEAFMAERHESTMKEVEQDRFVVTEIYQLRAIVETLGRRNTANRDFMDVRWEMRSQRDLPPKE